MIHKVGMIHRSSFLTSLVGIFVSLNSQSQDMKDVGPCIILDFLRVRLLVSSRVIDSDRFAFAIDDILFMRTSWFLDLDDRSFTCIGYSLFIVSMMSCHADRSGWSRDHVEKFDQSSLVAKQQIGVDTIR